MQTIYGPGSLPKNDNINRFSYSLDVSDTLFIQKGKMIAYYGRLTFEMIGTSALDILTKEAFNSPLYIGDFVVVSGRGSLILGDLGNDIAGYDLEDANMTIRAKNLLALPPTVRCQESTVPGFLTLMGTGRILASSNGPAHFIEPPCRVDEQAVLGWADCPCPSYRYDYEHVRSFISAAGAMTGFTLSGEEKQLDFFGKGTVLVQSSELELQGRGLVDSIVGQLRSLGKSDLSIVSAAVSRQMASSR
ncbi:MAG: AIM24 family protein [Deltaproteobacteria bacterium]|nr:AIM24 family protein [Deltaproteobacteria bacterium]